MTVERQQNGPLREELWRVEDRLTARIDRSRNLFESYIRDHAALHREHSDWSEEQLNAIKAKFAELAEQEQEDEVTAARRAGTWSLLLLTVTVLSRYWVIVVAALVAVAAFLGRLSISIAP